MTKLFGTDGIRAVAGEYPLDPLTIFKLGRLLPQLGRRRILVGRDTRASGVWIERLLDAAIRSAGGEVTRAGVITTPGVSFLCRRIPFDAGVVISASHNPYIDNGIKIFSGDGTKLSDQEEGYLEQSIHDDSSRYPLPADPHEGCQANLTLFDETLIGQYAGFLSSRPSVKSLYPLKVVLDCANGAAFHVAPRVFRNLGAEVVTLNAEPDGHNINDQCGALFPEQMGRATRDYAASFGVAFDGDSDRSILADEEGRLVDGDQLLWILGRYLNRLGRMGSGCVVTTVMANMGLEVSLRREGLRMLRTQVGDRYVLEQMLQGDHWLGGEQSGHIIIREESLAGDGILTALKIAQIMVEERAPLSRLCQGLQKFPQVLLNLRVRDKRDFSGIASIRREIEAAERNLGDRGRVLVRYSGTEPVARIMIEGESEEQIRTHAEAIAARFQEELGVASQSGPGDRR